MPGVPRASCPLAVASAACILVGAVLPVGFAIASCAALGAVPGAVAGGLALDDRALPGEGVIGHPGDDGKAPSLTGGSMTSLISMFRAQLT